MGNSLKARQYRKGIKGNKKLGKITQCPVCRNEFAASTTHFTMNSHVDNCLQNNSNATHLGIVEEEEEKVNVSEENRSTEGTKISKYSAEEGKFLDFESKMIWFNGNLDKERISWKKGADVIVITRDHIIENSMVQIETVNLHKELKIGFLGEITVEGDAGGLSREWSSAILEKMFNSGIGLFRQCDTDIIRYTINPRSTELLNWEALFQFFGKVIGKALFDRIPIPVYLAPHLFKQLLNESVSVEDFQGYDQHLFSSLRFISTNIIRESLEIYFCHETELGIYNLLPDGENIKVTDENKEEYITLKTKYLLTESIQEQLEAIKKGIHCVIDSSTLSVFNGEELEQAICGPSFVDLEDWKFNTVYKGEYCYSHKTITWFWKALDALSQEDLRNFLQFCTGTPRVPIGGFKDLESNRGKIDPFCIQSVRSKGRKAFELPQAHTCFNRIHFPVYHSYEKVEWAIKYVLNTQSYGFGLDNQFTLEKIKLMFR